MNKLNQKQKLAAYITASIILLSALLLGGFFVWARYFANNKTTINIVEAPAITRGVVELPQNISITEAKRPTETTKSEIRKLINDRVSSLPVTGQDIVISITKDGKPIIPETKNEEQSFFGVSIARAEGENMLEYAMPDPPPDSPFETWTSEEKASLEETFDRAYRLNHEILGAPAVNGTVKVYKDNIRGYYSAYLNEIVVPSTDAGTMAHEMTHSFHNIYVFNNRAWEEGMAILAQKLYTNRYSSIPVIGYAATDSMLYAQNNQPLLSTPYFYSDSFQKSTEPVSEGEHYAYAGYAVGKIYTENKESLIGFNQDYYASMANRGYLSESEVSEILTKNFSSIEGITAEAWLSQNYIMRPAFNQSELLGLFYGSDVFFMRRAANGYETELFSKAKVSASVYNLDGTKIQEGEYTTDEDGRTSINDILSAGANILINGAYRIELAAESASGQTATASLYRSLVVDKNDQTQRTNSLWGYTLVKSGPVNVTNLNTGEVQALTVANYMLIVPGISAGDRLKINFQNRDYFVNVMGKEEYTSKLLLGSVYEKTAEKKTKIVWTNPSDPTSDLKPGAVNVFTNDSLTYDKSIINLCLRIEGDYIQNTVKINGNNQALTKNEVCSQTDLKIGENRFTATAINSIGDVVKSERTIVRNGGEELMVADLLSFYPYVYLEQASSNIHIGFSILNIAKLTSDVTVGVAVNGAYFKPGVDPYDLTIGRDFYTVARAGLSEDRFADNGFDIKIETPSSHPFKVGENKVCVIVDPLQKLFVSNRGQLTNCQTVVLP